MNAAQAAAEASDNSIVPGVLVAGEPFTGQTLSTAAIAIVYGSSIAVSAIAEAGATGDYESAGPVRSGLLEFAINLSRAHGGDSSLVITDGVRTYSEDALSGPGPGCGIAGCSVTETLPFDLGAPFSVSASATVSESLTAGSTTDAHGSDSAAVVFTLLASDGTTPVPFSTVSPEPATRVLGFGLLAGTANRSRRGGNAR